MRRFLEWLAWGYLLLVLVVVLVVAAPALFALAILDQLGGDRDRQPWYTP